MNEVINLTVDQFLKSGAMVSIRFHDCKNYREACDVLKPYMGLGMLLKKERDGTFWLEILNGNVEIFAFYDAEVKTNE